MITSEVKTNEDITGVYNDDMRRLESLKIIQGRYTSLLDKAANAQERLDMEKDLAQIISGKIELYEERIQYAFVDIKTDSVRQTSADNTKTDVKPFPRIDAALWGGYGIGSGIGKDGDAAGWQGGFKVHYNLPVTSFFSLGLGSFIYHTRSDADRNVGFQITTSGGAGKMKATAAGIDIALIFGIPSISLYPYLRGTYTLWNYIEMPDRTVLRGRKWDANCGIGGGVEYAIYSRIRIFGEFMYDEIIQDRNKSFGEYGGKFNFFVFNLGLKYALWL